MSKRVVFPIDRPPKPGVTVTDVLFRGGGGTVTFSDNVTFEWVWKFDRDPTIPAGGRMKITLVGDRATLLYQTIVDQSICDLFDWLLQCTSINTRLSQLELQQGLAKEITFEVADWGAGTANTIRIIASGIPGAGEVGPHELPVEGKAYAVTVFKDGVGALTIGVDVGVEIDLGSGLITLTKAGLAAPFDGRAIITGSA